MIEDQFNIKILPIWSDSRGDGANAEKLRNDEYIRSIRFQLSKILVSRCGRALANSLRYHQKTIWLMPYEGNDGNAQERSFKGDSEVLYTPQTGASCCSRKKGANLPHEILFHELVHSLRTVSGQMPQHQVFNKLKPYHTNEEFIAILVTNIFISDVTNPGKSSLRNDHTSHAVLDPELTGSYRFFLLGTTTFNLIANFCDQNRGFTAMLGNVPARFNPIAAYHRNRRKAFEMAARGDAEWVFERMTPMDYVKNGGVWERIISYAGPQVKS